MAGSENMTAHRDSDNRAITAAEIAKLVNAKKAVLAAAQRLVERPVRWNRLALQNAAVALCDEHTASQERENAELKRALLALESAASVLCDEHTATLERENNRKPGAYGRCGSAFTPIVPRHVTAGESAVLHAAILASSTPVAPGRLVMPERGERALNRVNREALAEMGAADGEELLHEPLPTTHLPPSASRRVSLVMGDSGPRTCAEIDGDCA
jgi:hypothetical protein